MPGRVRIGISGWNYKGWRGKFYPPKLPQKQELAYAGSLFPSIEVNGTFYGLQRPSAFLSWVEQTPAEFVFAIKGSRFITHMLKLKSVKQALANFFASGPLALGPKLGPFLWQFPPQFAFNADRFEEFFKLLPQNTTAAAELARRHDQRLEGRAFTESLRHRPLRHAVEIRHESFRSPEFIKLLRRYRIANVVADTVGWPRLMDVTSDFVYCRLHGSEVLYTSGYTDVDLDLWVTRIAAWASGRDCDRAHPQNDFACTDPPRSRAARDVYVYFDNDAKVYAPVDAQNLITRVNALLHEKAA
ncbi:MAG TPA: DUF72 domain-containing protein [Acidobacteriaceae bacterium]|jgi:uncharacterized protein YecE (DUF72 family)|nr:DUF72 domain-containing protein [Acidobacteriaceae bacterium]